MTMLEKYSSSNPAYRLRPGFRFAFSAPSHAIALFFGAGCLRPGPGTWGSLAAALVFLLFEALIPASFLWIPGVAAFLIGIWAAGRTGDDLGVQDAGAIVIDEVAAVRRPGGITARSSHTAATSSITMAPAS